MLVEPAARTLCHAGRAHPHSRLPVVPARGFRALLITLYTPNSRRCDLGAMIDLTRRNRGESAMRCRLHAVSLAALSVIAIAPAGAIDLPARKAGLWEVKM